jgi:hypothetical protein
MPTSPRSSAPSTKPSSSVRGFFEAMSMVLLFVVVIGAMFSWMAVTYTARQDRDTADYRSEIAKIQEINTPVFAHYAEDLEQYGVNISAQEYEQLFFSSDGFVAPVNGKPQMLSVSEGSSGKPTYLLADGAVLAEVEPAPVVDLDKEALRKGVWVSDSYTLTAEAK